MDTEIMEEDSFIYDRRDLFFTALEAGIVGIIIGIFLTAYIAAGLTPIDIFFEPEEKYPFVENYTECKNESITITADCLVNYIRPFYNYTIRNDTDKTLDDLKENGGDCYDWSNLYVQMARGLNLTAKPVVIDGGGPVAHRIAIITNNETDYCIMDQLNKPRCYL